MVIWSKKRKLCYDHVSREYAKAKTVWDNMGRHEKKTMFRKMMRERMARRKKPRERDDKPPPSFGR